MEITASLVKELRERTGAGMMECKKALTEANGDVDAAAEALRKSGLAKADKKASRVAAEGRVATAQADGRAVLVEVNSETDFVAKDENFLAFTDAVAAAALAIDGTDVESLKAAKLASGETVEEARAALIAKVGENVQVRRMARVDSGNNIAAYVHGGRIGVLVEVKGGDADLARGLAMHVAAMNPPYNNAADVPADFVAKEKEIELAKMSEKDKAKPAEILEKITVSYTHLRAHERHASRCTEKAADLRGFFFCPHLAMAEVGGCKLPPCARTPWHHRRVFSRDARRIWPVSYTHPPSPRDRG